MRRFSQRPVISRPSHVKAFSNQCVHVRPLQYPQGLYATVIVHVCNRTSCCGTLQYAGPRPPYGRANRKSRNRRPHGTDSGGPGDYFLDDGLDSVRGNEKN